jgi:Flp pilus assembly protein TadG
MSARPGFLARFLRDTRAVSAIEFALIAPILIASYLGAVQLSLGLLFLDSAQIDDIVAAGAAIMQPFDESDMAVRITSVRMNNDGDIFVDWSEGRNGLSGYGQDSVLDLPEGLLAPSNSIIFVEMIYTYSTPFNTLELGEFTLTDKAYLRPRRSLWIRRRD